MRKEYLLLFAILLSIVFINAQYSDCKVYGICRPSGNITIINNGGNGTSNITNYWSQSGNIIYPSNNQSIHLYGTNITIGDMDNIGTWSQVSGNGFTAYGWFLVFQVFPYKYSVTGQRVYKSGFNAFTDINHQDNSNFSNYSAYLTWDAPIGGADGYKIIIVSDASHGYNSDHAFYSDTNSYLYDGVTGVITDVSISPQDNVLYPSLVSDTDIYASGFCFLNGTCLSNGGSSGNYWTTDSSQSGITGQKNGNIYLGDNSNNTVLSTNNRFLYGNNGIESEDWGNRYLLDSMGTPSLDWLNYLLIDGNHINSIDWMNRLLNLDWKVNGSLSVNKDVVVGIPPLAYFETPNSAVNFVLGNTPVAINSVYGTCHNSSGSLLNFVDDGTGDLLTTDTHDYFAYIDYNGNYWALPAGTVDLTDIGKGYTVNTISYQTGMGGTITLYGSRVGNYSNSNALSVYGMTNIYGNITQNGNEVCDMSGNCGSSGSMDYTNIAMTNKSNNFTGNQNFQTANITNNVTLAGIYYYTTTGACNLTLVGSDCNNGTARYIIGGTYGQ